MKSQNRGRRGKGRKEKGGLASSPSCGDLAGDERRNAADLSSQRKNVLLIPLTPRSFFSSLPFFLYSSIALGTLNLLSQQYYIMYLSCVRIYLSLSIYLSKVSIYLSFCKYCKELNQHTNEKPAKPLSKCQEINYYTQSLNI